MLLKDLETNEVDEIDFEECGMNWLTATRKTVEATTTARRLSSLRRFAVWAGWDARFVDYSAPQGLKAKPHPLPEGIDGVKRMIYFASNREQAGLVALCGLMGLRIGEALTVRASHFDIERMMLHVYGKGSKEREVPISEAAWTHLQDLVLKSFMCHDTPLIPFADRAARGMITKVGLMSGLSRRVASHDLRATFATSVYSKTKDIRAVQLLLGHSSSKQTEVYIGVTEATLKASVEL